jgi:hypothetical protein
MYFFFSLLLLEITIVVVFCIDVVDVVKFKAIVVFEILSLEKVVIIDVVLLASVVVAHPETNYLFNI